MDLGLNGKVALVGGSSRGLGRAVAEELAAEGCAVVLCSRDAEAVALEMKGYDAAWQENQLATQLQQLADLESKYLREGLKTA